MPKPRKKAKIIPGKTLKIFCEGQKTEPNYIEGYIATLRNDNGKTVVRVEPTSKNTAVQLVDVAIKAKKSSSSLPNDEFWVVYDRESIAKYSDQNHAKAYDRADKSGINVAICNVCFEYWILLHLIDTDAPYQNYDDLHKNSPLNNEMKKLFGVDYNKSSTTLFSLIKDRIEIARVRGSRINEKGKDSAISGRDKPFYINTYVGIVELLKSIDNFTENKKEVAKTRLDQIELSDANLKLNQSKA